MADLFFDLTVETNGQEAVGYGSLHESALSEPFVSGSDARILFTGELHNRRELVERLDTCGIETDAELALEAYHKWGADFPKNLIGPFAYVIRDEANDRLYCGRDKTGIRGLFYYTNDEVVLVGNDLAAILEHPAVVPQVNTKILGEYLRGKIFTRRQTFYRDVKMVEKGEYVDLLGNEVTVQYWTPYNGEPKDDDPKKIQKQFLKVFKHAVDCRIDDLSNLGFTLSGGLDSTAIVSITDKLGYETSDCKSFSQVFESIGGEALNVTERNRIERMIDRYDLDSHCLVSDSETNDVSRLQTSVGHPWRSAIVDANERLYDEVDSQGCRVLFRGEGGNLFNGDLAHYLDTFSRDGAIETVRNVWRDEYSKAKLIFALTRAYTKHNNHEGLFKLIHRLGDRYPSWITRSVRKEMPNTIEWSDTDVQWPDSYELRTTYEFYWERMYDFQKNIGDIHMLQHGIKPLYPLWDARLIEFLFSLPPGWLYHGGTDKQIFRDGLEGVLPSRIRKSTEKPLFDPLLKQTVTEEADVIRNRLSSPTCLAELGVVTDEAINPLIDMVIGGELDQLDTVWRLVTAETWLQDNRTAIENEVRCR